MTLTNGGPLISLMTLTNSGPLISLITLTNSGPPYIITNFSYLS